MLKLDQPFENACMDGTLIGAVLIAADKSGITHSKAYGLRSAKDPDSALKEDDILYIASCTKLLTSIAAMQCVERGLIRLEDDVTTLLPELGKLPVLTGFDDEGKPILTKRIKTITLRNLLTHTSGLAYDFGHPDLIRYRSSGYTEAEGNDGGNPVVVKASAALVFEPSTSWVYGASLDWCGKLIERLTNQSLEEYMKSSIFTPLGITDITFWPSKRPELGSRMMGKATRTDSGRLVDCDLPPFAAETIDTEECFGGHGAHASMPDFFKVLQSILLDDEKLLKKSTTAELFKPQLTPEERNGMRAIQATPRGLIGYHEDVELDCSLCGGLFLNDHMDIGRGKPTLFWAGFPNLNWFIDRQVGVCGLYGTQIIPHDAKAQAMRTSFEKAIYDKVNERI